MTDPIADMLTRIRDAVAAKHSRVDIPASKLKIEIARILKEEGYINHFVVKGDGLKRTIRIFLRYSASGTSITYLTKVTRPGRRLTSEGAGLRKRKSSAPDLLYPTLPCSIGKERIEAVVGLNLFKLFSSLQESAKTSAPAERSIERSV